MTTNSSEPTEYIEIRKPQLIYECKPGDKNSAESLRLCNRINSTFKALLVTFISFLSSTTLADPIEMKDSNYQFLIDFVKNQLEEGYFYKINYLSKVPEYFEDNLNELIEDMKAFKVEYKDSMIAIKLWNYYGFQKIAILMNRHKLNTMTELKNKFSCDELMEIIKKQEHTLICVPKFYNSDF